MRQMGWTRNNRIRKMSCTLFNREWVSLCCKVKGAALNRAQHFLYPQAQSIGLKISARIFQPGSCFGDPRAESLRQRKQGVLKMNEFTSPQVVVQRQLDAYNAKNLDAWLATYAPDAQQFELGGKLLASGHAQISARTALRFEEPHLHAQLLSRTV